MLHTGSPNVNKLNIYMAEHYIVRTFNFVYLILMKCVKFTVLFNAIYKCVVNNIIKRLCLYVANYVIIYNFML